MDLVQTPQGPLIATVSNYCLLDYKMHFFCRANLRIAAFNGVCIKRGLLLWLLPAEKVLLCTGSNKHIHSENNQCDNISTAITTVIAKAMLCKGKRDQALLEIALCKTCKKPTRLSQMMKQVHHPLSLCRCAHIAKLFSVLQRINDHSFPTLHGYFS